MLPKIDRSGTLVDPHLQKLSVYQRPRLVLDKGYARYPAAVGWNVMVASRSSSSSGMLYGCVNER